MQEDFIRYRRPQSNNLAAPGPQARPDATPLADGSGGRPAPGAPAQLGGPPAPPRPAATPLSSPGAAQRLPARSGPVYRGLPWPVKAVGWLILAIVVGAVIGATAPTALMRVGAVAALQPGLLAWYCVRALGFLAYLVLAASVLYGLLLSTKILDAIAHRPVSFALHKDLSIVGLLLGALHGTLLVFDQSYRFTLVSILVPFESPYSPLTVGVGQLALYATAIVTASFYVRRHIGQKVWRLIHYITFLAFAGASFHGLASGSDSRSAWAFWVYLTPLTAALFLITYRIVVGASNRLFRPRVERAGTPGALAAPRGPLDRPGAASGDL
jgi:hypothetical protein